MQLHVPVAQELMVSAVFTLSPEASLLDAIDMLLDRRLPGAPVVEDESRCCVGILTEKDCLRVLTGVAYDHGESSGKVKDYMSPVTVYVEPTMDIFGVTQRFLSCNFAALPVLEEGHKLFGLITRRGILKGIKELERRIVAVMRYESIGRKPLRYPTSIEELQNLVANEKKEHVAALLTMRHSDLPRE